MAKLKDDYIRWILSLDAQGVQKEIATTSSVINKLTDENKQLTAEMRAIEKQIASAEREMRKLEDAGKMNTKTYKNVKLIWEQAKGELNEYSKKIAANKAEIDKQREANEKLIRHAKITDLTYSQLRQRAKQLEDQMKNTVKSLQPEEWKKLNNEYKMTIRRMGELEGKSKSVIDTLKSTLTSKLTFASVIANIYIKGLQLIKQGITKVKEFTVESVKMATAAQGIDVAFNRIANKDYLKSLRQSTRGLVNDMELMKAAVRAENFKIPLDKLGGLLAFAQQRAKDTGESVDYLVESIVNGIGRKSPLILDNLGISAVKLNEEVKKTGDFATAVANIVEQEMGKVGKSVDLATDKVNRKKVAWENLQLELGKRFLWLSEAWSSVSTAIAEGLERIVSTSKNAVNSYDDQIKKVAELDLSISVLAERYDKLKIKTGKSTDEQDELKKIMNQIIAIVPEAKGKFDEYGNALTINTEKVREYVAAERARLKIMREAAIKETEKELASAKKRRDRAQKEVDAGGRIKLKRGGNLYSKGVEVDSSKLGKSISDLQKYGEEVEELEKKLEDYTGVAYEKQVAKRYEFNQKNEKELKAWIDDEKNAKDEYLTIAKEVYNLKFANQINDDKEDTVPSGKTEAERLAERQEQERKKIIENAQISIDIETRAYNNRLKQFGLYGLEMKEMTEEQLRDRLKLDEEFHSELQKIALEAEDLRFKQAQEAAGVSEKSEGEHKKVYERLEEQHQANIQKIKDESAKKRKDTQKQADAALLKIIQEAGKASVDAVNATEAAKLLELKQKLAENRITREQYEKDVKDLEASSLADRLTAQEAYVQKLKELTNPTEEQIKALEAAEAAVQATQAKIYENKINEEKAFQERRQAVIKQYGLETISQQYDAEMAALRKQHEDGIIEVEEYEQAKLLIGLEYAKKYVDKVGEYVQAGSDLVRSIEEAETANTQAEYAERHTALKEQLDSGIISHEEYNAQKEQLDYDQRVAELEVQKKYADANFAMQVSQIAVTTATGIIGAWATSISQLGPIAGPIAAAAMTAILLGTAAAQIASANAERNRVKALTIESPGGGSGISESSNSGKTKTGTVMLKDTPGGFADGGYTGDGGKYEIAGFLADGRPFHRGEYFIAQEEMSHPAVVPMVRAIESIRRKRTDKNPLPAGFAEGGYTQPDNRTGNYVLIDEKLIVRFEKAVENFEKTKLPVEINYWEWKKVEEDMDKINDLSKRI
ncbi:MAG TPA: hypothetical protein PK978_06845 [Paludibacter sp.]|nr:hypothetical protein [Paludibacter sp.]